jgi:hypothetical protein
MRYNNKGITLLELAIGILITSVIVSSAMSLYLTQHKTMLAQDEISHLQLNARNSTVMLVDLIRNAGYNIPETLNAIETFDTNPDTIVITFDSSNMVDVELSSDMTSRAALIQCYGVDLSFLLSGDWVYIYDPFTESGEFFEVTGVTLDPASVLHSGNPLSKAYPAGSQITMLNRLKIFVDQPDSTHSNLMIQKYGKQPEIHAENISGLNFRYFLSDGTVTDFTYFTDLIRSVEIDVTAISSEPDPEFNNFYRTRNHTVQVKVRNLGIS